MVYSDCMQKIWQMPGYSGNAVAMRVIMARKPCKKQIVKGIKETLEDQGR